MMFLHLTHKTQHIEGHGIMKKGTSNTFFHFDIYLSKDINANLSASICLASTLKVNKNYDVFGANTLFIASFVSRQTKSALFKSCFIIFLKHCLYTTHYLNKRYNR